MSFVRRVVLSPFSKVARKSFATYKTSTGLVGLNVDPNGRENLLKISNEILESVKVLAADESLHIFCCFAEQSNFCIGEQILITAN